MKRVWQSPWMPWLVIGLAVALRAWKLGEWSLWEDEETTIYFSQNVGRPFPRFFPVFFVMLREWFQLTGLSVLAGRALAAAVGVVGVAATYEVCRRLVSRSAGLWAALLLAVNLGHLFWSQSIRYFGLLLVLEVLSLYWFYQGFERRKPWLLLASNVAFGLALWTHFSAVLLAPVFVGYLLLAAWWPRVAEFARILAVRNSDRLTSHEVSYARNEDLTSHEASYARNEDLTSHEASYRLVDYAAFGVPLVLVMVAFAKSLLDAKGFLSTMALPSARNPLHVMVTLAAYVGLPVLALAAIAPLAAVRLPRRTLLFLVCCAWVPVAELAVIAGLNHVNVTWYYAIIVLFGMVALAGVALASLAERGRSATVAALGLVCGVYAAVNLGAYYTAMHGDRPRWRDAAEYVRQTAQIDPTATGNPDVFANVPGVVAFYLGVSPDATMGDKLVRMLPDEPPSGRPLKEQWYVLEAGHGTPHFHAWLDAACSREASFTARTGPRDRTVTVYRCRGPLSSTARND